MISSTICTLQLNFIPFSNPINKFGTYFFYYVPKIPTQLPILGILAKNTNTREYFAKVPKSKINAQNRGVASISLLIREY